MSTGIDVFDSSIEKSLLIIKTIQTDLGWDDARGKERAYQAMRVVLHTFRDRLRVDDAVNFASQLPLILKGTFYDGWKSEQVPVKLDGDEFIDCVACNFPLDVEGGARRVIYSVMTAIFDAIDPGEADKVTQFLPEELSELFFNYDLTGDENEGGQ